MSKTFSLALAAIMPVAAVALAPAAHAQTAQPAAAGSFVQSLADRVFGVLRNPSLAEADRQTQFRQMLREAFAVRQIGDRLIRRHRATITPAQYNSYTTAFPDFVVGTYADRLEAYTNASFKVTRTLEKGTRGDADVYTRITSPGGGQPIEAVWAVRRDPSGRFLITNLTVSGVNLALTQEADFASYIERNGFDALVRFMRGTRA